MALSQRPRRSTRRRHAQQDVTEQGFSLLTAISAATDPRSAMQVVARGLPPVLGAQQAAVVLFESPPDHASVCHTVLDDASPFTIDPRGPLANWIRREQQPFIRETASELLSVGAHKRLVPHNAPAMIVAPLMLHSRVAGCVGVFCATSRRWRTVDCALVESVARQLSTTLARLEQLDALEGRARLLTAVHDAATRSSQEQELPAALKVIAEQARQLADADTARVTLCHTEFAVNFGEARRTLAHTRQQRRDERSPVHTICLPLALGDRILGVLDLSRHAPTAFSLADETLIQTFAPYAAAAINMAEQHARLERLLNELAQLARGAVAPADTSATIAVVAEAGRRLLGADCCVLAEATSAGPLAHYSVGCSDTQLPALLALPTPQAATTGTVALSGLVPLDDTWYAVLPLAASEIASTKLVFGWRRRPDWETLRPAAEIVANQLAQLLAGSALYQAALESTRLKYEFMSTVSHELRTPMGAIIGYTELLANNLYGTIPGAMRDPLVRLKANAAQLLQQINQILDLSRIEAGRLELHVAPFQPRDLVRAVADAVQEEASAKGLALRFAVDPEVPAIAWGDVGRLRQILVNLVGNSIKFTQHGTVELQCKVVGSGTTPELAFVVCDTGPGIALEEQDSLWQPFRQGQQATRERSGTGLGLAVVYKLTELMRGRVTVDSELGRGSCFTIRLPLERPA